MFQDVYKRQVMNCSSIHHELHEIAMNLSRETSDPVEWILAAMAFLQERIVYDPGLAQAYDQGKKTGLTLSEAWVKRKGTCREIAMAMAGLRPTVDLVSNRPDDHDKDPVSGLP